VDAVNAGAPAPIVDVVDSLRRRMTLMSGDIQSQNSVAVPDWLGRHLTRGGLPRGEAVDAADCPTALIELLVAVTAAGGCAAVVGYPQLALAAVGASGGDLGVGPRSLPHGITGDSHCRPSNSGSTAA